MGLKQEGGNVVENAEYKTTVVLSKTTGIGVELEENTTFPEETADFIAQVFESGKPGVANFGNEADQEQKNLP